FLWARGGGAGAGTTPGGALPAPNPRPPPGGWGRDPADSLFVSLAGCRGRSLRRVRGRAPPPHGGRRSERDRRGRGTGTAAAAAGTLPARVGPGAGGTAVGQARGGGIASDHARRGDR